MALQVQKPGARRPRVAISLSTASIVSRLELQWPSLPLPSAQHHCAAGRGIHPPTHPPIHLSHCHSLTPPPYLSSSHAHTHTYSHILSHTLSHSSILMLWGRLRHRGRARRAFRRTAGGTSITATTRAPPPGSCGTRWSTTTTPTASSVIVMAATTGGPSGAWSFFPWGGGSALSRCLTALLR